MDDAFVVGIDFGTTFSGVAAAYSANPEAADEINIIKTWPGGNNITSDKVPSEVAYGNLSIHTSTAHRGVQRLGFGGKRLLLTEDADDGSTLGGAFNFDAFNAVVNSAQLSASTDESQSMRWGFQIRPDGDRLRCLKLFLDPRQHIPEYVSLPDTQRQLMACGKNVGTVVTEYLRALFEHSKAVLSRRYGAHFVATTKLKIVLTVPAVWSDAAKDATRKAAEGAGMGSDIDMISEPEAAAVYTLQAIQPNHLKMGHSFVVIDAGGGTVDLISYAIRKLNPLRLEELVEGSGACCGAAFLNVRFQQFVRAKLGAARFEQLCVTQPRTWLMALKYFEDYVKRNFDPAEQNVFNIPFPGVPDNTRIGIEGGFLTMDSTEVGALFKPIISEIIGLVEGQVSKLQACGHEVNGLILVGGFGQSECLRKCLQAQFGEGVSTSTLDSGAQSAAGRAHIEVLQPTNAWTAVVRGAVLRGLEGTEVVLNRKARRHYGIECQMPYNSLIHPASCKGWDELQEKDMAQHRMQWYIRKGQTVSSTEPVLFSFYSCFEHHEARTMVQELIFCDDDVAPDGFESHQGARTKVACKTVVNLQTVPQHLWKESRNASGRTYHRLDYEVGMQIESGGLRFDMRVDGVVYGKVTATFK